MGHGGLRFRVYCACVGFRILGFGGAQGLGFRVLVLRFEVCFAPTSRHNVNRKRGHEQKHIGKGGKMFVPLDFRFYHRI